VKLHETVVRFFAALSHYAIRHPRRVLWMAGLVTLAAAPGMFRLTLRTDGHALVTPSAPEVVEDQAIREHFGLEDQVVVLIRAPQPGGVFNGHTLQLVRDLTADLVKLPGINPSNVMSLATEPSFRMRPMSLVHQTLLEPPLTTQAELDLLREDLRQIELYTGTLVSADGTATAVMLGAPPGEDHTRLYQRVGDIVRAHREGPEDIAVTGAPVAEALLGLHILEDLGMPKGMLGVSTRAEAGEKSGFNAGSASSFSAGLYRVRLFIARRIGLVPVAMGVMMLIFFLSFRNLPATLLPVPEVAATLLFVFGLMGWFHVPIYLTIAVMPVLLTAMCVTDEIHVFSRYFSLLREKPRADHVELVKETVDEMVCPVANTTLTTAIGFVSFAFSPLGPVQAFGIFTGVGVLFSLFYSLTVVPAMLTLINPERLVGRRKQEDEGKIGRMADWFGNLGVATARHRYWVAAGVVLVTALAPLGLRRLVIQDSWIDGFAPASEFRRATEMVNEKFEGMHLLLVTLDAPKTITGEVPASAVTPNGITLPAALVEDPAVIGGNDIALSAATPQSVGTNRPPSLATATVWKPHMEMMDQQGTNITARFSPSVPGTNFWRELAAAGRAHFEVHARTHVRPEVIRTIGDLAAFIRERRQDAVGGVLSPYEYLTTTRFMARPNDPTARVLPATGSEIKLMWDYYALARGRHRLRQVVDTNYWQSVTTVFLKNANFIDTARLMGALRDYEKTNLTPKGIRLGFAGDVAVSQSLIKGIVTTQLQSLFWSLVGIYAVTAVLGRSWRWGFYCVLPSTLAVVINFAVMGWFNIPLGVATSMFAGMTLGIGVDFAIHVLEGYGQVRTDEVSRMERLRRAMALTGPPVLVNTIAVSCGFGVLMLSQVPANAKLGLLVVLGLVDCLVASLLLLPVALHWWPLKDNREDLAGAPPPERTAAGVGGPR
jgi:predicted RND superfamily exporter protein